MAHESLRRALALTATVPAVATFYFAGFWLFFDFWRKRRAATYVFMLGSIYAFGFAVYHYRGFLFAYELRLPRALHVAGWLLVVAACLFGFIADRQIGLRVRSFAPFFEPHGRITLETTGVYGVVRHPIYASGVWYQIGAFLITGYWIIAAAWVVFTAGAFWFTRKEEQHLKALLADPTEYDRYRARVPALFPFLKRRKVASTDSTDTRSR